MTDLPKEIEEWKRLAGAAIAQPMRLTVVMREGDPEPTVVMDPANDAFYEAAKAAVPALIAALEARDLRIEKAKQQIDELAERTMRAEKERDEARAEVASLEDRGHEWRTRVREEFDEWRVRERELARAKAEAATKRDCDELVRQRDKARAERDEIREASEAVHEDDQAAIAEAQAGEKRATDALAAAQAREEALRAALTRALELHPDTANVTEFCDREGMRFYHDTSVWPTFKSAPLEMHHELSDRDRSERWYKWLDTERAKMHAAARAALATPPRQPESWTKCARCERQRFKSDLMPICSDQEECRVVITTALAAPAAPEKEGSDG